MRTITFAECDMRTMLVIPEGKEITAVNELKKSLKQRSGSRVLRQAIALLAEAVEMAGEKGFFLIESPDGEKIKIWLK